MTRCKYYRETFRKEVLLYGHTAVDVRYGYCHGTRECDMCNCGGDPTKCDFYPEVREKAEHDKPETCPCCHGDAEIKESAIFGDTVVFVRCKSCGLRTRPVVVDHPILTKNGLDETTRYTVDEAKEVALALWNRRNT